MQQITKHDVNKLTASELKREIPFQIISDGEVIAVCVSAYDVNKLGKKPKAKPDVNKADDLPFSKSRQAKGRLSEAEWEKK